MSLDLETSCTAVAVICGSYLFLRLLAVMLRVRWARRAYGGADCWLAAMESSDQRGDERQIPGLGEQTQEQDQQDQRRERLDRCQGAMLGLALGDALGLAAESLPPWLIALRFPRGPTLSHGLIRLTRRPGDISDDTQLSLAVARSIDPRGEYLHQRFLDELRLWRSFRIGAGRACSVAARRLRRAKELRPDEVIGVPSEGNGAAIRVAPLALARAGDEDPALLIQQVRENARVTHTSEVAITGAVFTALLIRGALLLPPGELRGDALEVAIGRAAQLSGFVVPAEAEHDPKAGLELAALLRRCGTSGHINQTLASVLVVLRRAGLDLVRGLEALYRTGGDVDSIGSILGAVVGAQLGRAGWPAKWVTRLQHREQLLAHGRRLATPTPLGGIRAAEILEVTGNVATRQVEAVVNAWNRNVIPVWLLLPQGVSKAIRKAGGAATIREVSRRGPIPLGSATESTGAELAARWVIHVAGINMAWRSSEYSVRLSTRNALQLARCLGARTVALPLIGAGSGGMSPGRVREVMMEEMARQRAHFECQELVSYG